MYGDAGTTPSPLQTAQKSGRPLDKARGHRIIVRSCSVNYTRNTTTQFSQNSRTTSVPKGIVPSARFFYFYLTQKEYCYETKQCKGKCTCL